MKFRKRKKHTQSYGKKKEFRFWVKSIHDALRVSRGKASRGFFSGKKFVFSSCWVDLYISIHFVVVVPPLLLPSSSIYVRNKQVVTQHRPRRIISRQRIFKPFCMWPVVRQIGRLRAQKKKKKNEDEAKHVDRGTIGERLQAQTVTLG